MNSFGIKSNLTSNRWEQRYLLNPSLEYSTSVNNIVNRYKQKRMKENELLQN